MKKTTLLLITIFLSLFLVSCKTSKEHCDAYSNKVVNEDEIDFDIRTKESQFSTTVTIK